jgi:hypothetical protein
LAHGFLARARFHPLATWKEENLPYLAYDSVESQVEIEMACLRAQLLRLYPEFDFCVVEVLLACEQLPSASHVPVILAAPKGTYRPYVAVGEEDFLVFWEL